ncbi:MAG: DNA repair and recombination protein RadB [Candidatus Woesearchaeota archaeon]
MKASSGSNDFDEFLYGGYETGIITAIYGPASAGKTLLCLLSAIKAAKEKKVLFIDTEGVSAERMKQLCKDEKVFENIIFFHPLTFNEQKNLFSSLPKMINNIGLIIVDTISMLYRIAHASSQDYYEINRELSKQIGLLAEIARRQNIPVIVTSQVYSDFDQKDKVNIVGGDILKYGAKCLIELQAYRSNHRRAILRKHRSIGEREVIFRIIEKGLEKIEQINW